ncbi:MAG: DUF1841 family protein [Gammaproteobacteria bacterium]
MFSPDRTSLRNQFAGAWRKHLAGQPLDALEAQIADLLVAHPEYHALIEDDEQRQRDFAPEDGQINPFLHLSLHLALRDQVATDRPAGIRAVFDGLCRAHGDQHSAEHQLLERLGEALWRAQRDGQMPDENAYLTALREDLGNAQRRGP